MLVVIEGIDKAGKTTLARRLVEYVEEHHDVIGEIWHRGIPKRHPLEEYELDLERDYPVDPDERARRFVVCDRWHLGEIVYGNLYRESKLSSGQAWHVDALLQSAGALQLILSPPPDVILERMARDGEDYLQIGDVQHVWDEYERLADVFQRSTVRFTRDLDRFDVRDLVGATIHRQGHAWKLAEFTTYVGPTRPEILLLGDERNGVLRGVGQKHRAAFVPYPATSGAWLCDTIAGTGLAERSVGLANAREENVTELVHALGSPRVVALGNEANEACDDVRCDHGKVPHPQYGRRFKHARREEYAQAILHAADTHREVNPWRN